MSAKQKIVNIDNITLSKYTVGSLFLGYVLQITDDKSEKYFFKSKNFTFVTLQQQQGFLLVEQNNF